MILLSRFRFLFLENLVPDLCLFDSGPTRIYRKEVTLLCRAARLVKPFPVFVTKPDPLAANLLSDGLGLAFLDRLMHRIELVLLASSIPQNRVMSAVKKVAARTKLVLVMPDDLVEKELDVVDLLQIKMYKERAIIAKKFPDSGPVAF